jgi:hypothetical protein
MSEKIGMTDRAGERVADDRLGMKSRAVALATFVRSCSTPMSVGIQGEWGAGKTSLMKMVASELRSDSPDPESRVLVHWFDTWQYGVAGDEDTLGLQLVRDLVAVLSTKVKDTNSMHRAAWVFQTASALAAKTKQAASAVGAGLAAAAVSSLSYGMVDGGTFVGAMTDRTETNSVSPISRVREEMALLVKEYHSGTDGRRIVVFVDDLDRIRPSRAVGLLEVLKNFVDVEHIVFVIACDRDVVREGVKQKLGIDDPKKVDAFFEKIFQVPFEMPVQAYHNQDLLGEYLRNARYKGAGGRNVVQDTVAMVSEPIEWTIGRNPRALKRFLNLVDLHRCIADANASKNASSDELKKDILARHYALEIILVAMYSRWPGLVRDLAWTADPHRLFGYLRALADPSLLDEQDEKIPGQEQGGHDHDEEVRGMLVGLTEGMLPSERDTEVEALNKCAEHINAILGIDKDSAGGAGKVSSDDHKKAYEWWWSQSVSFRVGEKKVATTRPPAWVVFREDARGVHKEYGDAFAGLASGLAAHFENSRFAKAGVLRIERAEAQFRLFVCPPDGRAWPAVTCLVGAKSGPASKSSGSVSARTLWLRVNLVGPEENRMANESLASALDEVQIQFLERTRLMHVEWGEPEPARKAYKLDYCKAAATALKTEDQRQNFLVEIMRTVQRLLEAVSQASVPVVPESSPRTV